MLKVFQNMRAEDPAYVPKLKELWSDLKLHIQEEEQSDLPALEKALASAENQGSSESLAKNFDRTKVLAHAVYRDQWLISECRCSSQAEATLPLERILISRARYVPEFAIKPTFCLLL
jgi:hypothetical protein